MAQLLRDHLDDLGVLIQVTARARGVATLFVEKDFWVTEVLRAATTAIEVEALDGTMHPVHTIFKGGTSLSRIFGLIERFSEDVDLLIGFPDAEVSVGAKDRVLKAIRDRVGVHLRLSADEIAVEGAATRGVKRNTRYHYPRLLQPLRLHASSYRSAAPAAADQGRPRTHPTVNRRSPSDPGFTTLDEIGTTPITTLAGMNAQISGTTVRDIDSDNGFTTSRAAPDHAPDGTWADRKAQAPSGFHPSNLGQRVSPRRARISDRETPPGHTAHPHGAQPVS